MNPDMFTYASVGYRRWPCPPFPSLSNRDNFMLMFDRTRHKRGVVNSHAYKTPEASRGRWSGLVRSGPVWSVERSVSFFLIHSLATSFLFSPFWIRKCMLA